MKTSQEYIDLIRQPQSELQERFGITSMRLFGSVARGDHHEGSDVDLFVMMPPKFFNYVLAAQYLGYTFSHNTANPGSLRWSRIRCVMGV